MSDTVALKRKEWKSASDATKAIKEKKSVNTTKLSLTDCMWDTGEIKLTLPKTVMTNCAGDKLYLDGLRQFNFNACTKAADLHHVMVDDLVSTDGTIIRADEGCELGDVQIFGHGKFYDVSISHLAVCCNGVAQLTPDTKIDRAVVEGSIETIESIPNIKEIHLVNGGKAHGFGANKDGSINITADNHLHYIEEEDLWIGY